MRILNSLLLAMLLGEFDARAALITANVSVTTAPLGGHPAGPFSLAFSLTDGAGIGNDTNLAFVTLIDFGLGGSSTGSPVIVGDVLGDVSTGLLFTDSQPHNSFFQSFVPGDAFTFTLSVTTNVDDPTPDVFTFTILDRDGIPIPTLYGAPLDFLIRLDITGDNPDILFWGGDGARQPFAGGAAIPLAAPVLLSNVPEPTSAPLLIPALLALLTVARRRQDQA